MKNRIDYTGERAILYREALDEYPYARQQDIEVMQRLLQPSKGERILGIGEGNGYFSKPILESIGRKGYYLASDPSFEQLRGLLKRETSENLEIQVAGAEDFVHDGRFDKVWSFGAFHHCMNQTQGMKNMYGALRTGGKLVLCDVFQGSSLARHFDRFVARYSLRGHEVKFLSEDFAQSLCYLAGFEDDSVEIVDLPQEWIFDSEKDLGRFIYKLHAMTLIPGTEDDKINQVIESCRDVLGIENKGGRFHLHWPMKCLRAEK